MGFPPSRQDLRNVTVFAAQPLEDVGVDGRPQYLDGDPLFSRVRAAAEVHDALAALSRPSSSKRPRRNGSPGSSGVDGMTFLHDRAAAGTTLP